MNLHLTFCLVGDHGGRRLADAVYFAKHLGGRQGTLVDNIRKLLPVILIVPAALVPGEPLKIPRIDVRTLWWPFILVNKFGLRIRIPLINKRSSVSGNQAWDVMVVRFPEDLVVD